MVTDKLKQLAALRAKAAALEAAVATERAKALAVLPEQYGFSDAKAFASAVMTAAGRGGRRGRPTGGRVAVPSAKRRGRKPRATVTDKTRVEVKKLVQAGKTGAAIAAALDLSPQTVQNIKKALGLVGKRKK